MFRSFLKIQPVLRRLFMRAVLPAGGGTALQIYFSPNWPNIRGFKLRGP
jgi:hypothetical protein